MKREDIFITTKLWNQYHSKEHVVSMAKAQNEAWGLEYIDLFLIHFPCALEYVDPKVKQYPVSKIPVPVPDISLWGERMCANTSRWVGLVG